MKVATQDLLGKLPDAGEIYLEQMIFSAFCSALRDDKKMTEAEKAQKIQEYHSSPVQKTITDAKNPAPHAKPKQDKTQVRDSSSGGSAL